MSIALLMMIKDEFNNAKNIIKSVEGVCDEKIVVITGKNRVKESGECKIVYFPWHDDYSTPLNAGLRVCRSKWVLRLDSDEEIDKNNLKIVEKTVNLDNSVWGYEVTQRGYLPQKRREFGVKTVKKHKNYTNGVDDRCIRLFRNDPRVFFEFNTHETIYNSLRRANLRYVQSDIVIHHWGKLNMDEKAPYYYKLAQERLRKYPDDMQSYYYVGVSAEFVGKIEESYDAFKAGYDKYKSEYYRLPMEHLKNKKEKLNA